MSLLQFSVTWYEQRLTEVKAGLTAVRDMLKDKTYASPAQRNVLRKRRHKLKAQQKKIEELLVSYRDLLTLRGE